MANPKPNMSGLRPYQPGNPGGPGRPRKRPQTEANDDLLRRVVPKEIAFALRKFGAPLNATWADIFSLCLAREGLKGNVAAIKELRESTEGKSTQRIELQHLENKTVEVLVTYESEVEPRNMDQFQLPAKSQIIDVVAEEPAQEAEKSEKDRS